MERKGIQETESGNRTGRIKLKRLKIEGYKSLRKVEVGFGDVTVLLGANGAGKSNLVSFFRMLGFLSTGALQEFIGRSGRSESLARQGVTGRTLVKFHLDITGRVRDVEVAEGSGNAVLDQLALRVARTYEFTPIVFKGEATPGVVTLSLSFSGGERGVWLPPVTSPCGSTERSGRSSMKTLKVGIAGYDQVTARTVAIASGDHTPAEDEPKVWFTSIESFAKLLSESNRHLLELMGLRLQFALLVHDPDAALLAERRVGEHHREAVAGVAGQAVDSRPDR